MAVGDNSVAIAFGQLGNEAEQIIFAQGEGRGGSCKTYLHDL